MRMSLIKGGALLGLLLAALGAGVACAAEEPAAPTATSAPPPAAAPTATARPAAGSPAPAAPVTKPAKLAPRLKVALTSFAHNTLKIWLDGHHIAMPAFDPFVAKDQQGNIDPNKSAASWTVSPDFTTWTFKPNARIRFQDGQPVEAEDLKLSVDFYTMPVASGGIPFYYQTHVKRSQLVSQEEYVLEFDEPHLGTVLNDLSLSQPTLLANMDSVEQFLGGKQVDSFKAAGPEIEAALEKAFEKPNASGPFKVAEFVPSDRAIYEANPNYWDEGPYFDSMQFNLVKEPATQIALLTTGETDVINVTSPMVDTLEKAGLRAAVANDAAWVFGVFGNLYQPGAPGYDPNLPWMDVRVREALNISIDRQQILQTFYKNRARIQTDPQLGPGVVGWDFAKNKNNPIPFDPQRARDLLKQAGKEGITVGLRINPAPFEREAELPALSEAIADMWKQNLGIKVEISNVQPDDAQKREKRESFPFIWFATEEATPFGGETRLFKWTPEHKEGWYDIGGEEGKRLWEAVAKETNLEKRARATAEYADFLRRQWAMFPLFQKPQFWGIGSRIDSWTLAPGVLWPNSFNLIKPKP